VVGRGVGAFGGGGWGGGANLAVAAGVSECGGGVAGIRNPNAVKRDVECRLVRGRRSHALTDGAHVTIDALDSLIGVLAARQARTSGVHLPVRLLGRSALVMTRLAKLLRGVAVVSIAVAGP